MTAVFPVPGYVAESMERRARAKRTKPCVYDGCDSPAVAARGGSAARCDTHDRDDFTAPPVPDPTRSLAALRARSSEESST